MNFRVVSPLAVGILIISLAACGTAANGSDAGPSPWPAKGKSVKLIIGFAPGGATDSAGRVVAKALAKELGTDVVVENVPGAGGQVGFTKLANAAPDGYTVGAANALSLETIPFDKTRGAAFTHKSFLPLAQQVSDPMLIAVSKTSPYKDLKSLIEYAKANPGKLNATTTGLQTGEHFALTELKQLTGAEFNLVHFSEGTAAALAAFLGHHVPIYMANVSNVASSKALDIRVLGVMSAERSPSLPDVPTFKEQGYDIEQYAVRGYLAPDGLPGEVAKKLENAFGKAIQDPEVVDQMRKLGLPTEYGNSVEFNKYMDGLSATIERLLPLMNE